MNSFLNSLLLSSAIAYHFFSFSFFLSFSFCNIILRPCFPFPCPLLCFSLLLASAIAYHFFYVNAFKLHPSKQTSLNNIASALMVYPRPAFIPGLSFYFTHFTLFFFSYTYSRLSVSCGYFSFEISNFPSSHERKSNLMPATFPRKDFDPKRKFVFLPCMRARQPSSRT